MHARRPPLQLLGRDVLRPTLQCQRQQVTLLDLLLPRHQLVDIPIGPDEAAGEEPCGGLRGEPDGEAGR